MDAHAIWRLYLWGLFLVPVADLPVRRTLRSADTVRLLDS